MAEIRLESSPPDKNVATGTSDTSCRSIARDEVAHPAGRRGEVVGVVVVLEPPVGVQGQAGGLGLIDSVLAGQQLPHILKYAAARRASGAKQQHLGQAVGIDAGRHSRVRQQGLQLTANISEFSACV